MDGIHGPIWVQDLQGRVLQQTLVMGVLLRVALGWIHVKSEERLWGYCFFLALGVTLLTFFEMGLSLGIHNLRGIVEATVALTVGTMGTHYGVGLGIDRGAKKFGIDPTLLQAKNRGTAKLEV